MIEPLRDNVIIEPMTNPKPVPGEITLPDRPVSSPHFGRVVYTGPDVKVLKPYDIVILPTWNDDELVIGNVKYVILAEKAISVRISE